MTPKPTGGERPARGDITGPRRGAARSEPPILCAVYVCLDDGFCFEARPKVCECVQLGPPPARRERPGRCRGKPGSLQKVVLTSYLRLGVKRTGAKREMSHDSPHNYTHRAPPHHHDQTNVGDRAVTIPSVHVPGSIHHSTRRHVASPPQATPTPTGTRRPMKVHVCARS